MKNAVFLDVTKCDSGKNRHFGGMYHFQLQGEKIGELGTTLAVTRKRNMLPSNTMFLVTADDVPSLLILVTFLVEAIHSFETSILARVKRHNIPQHGFHRKQSCSLILPYALPCSKSLIIF
jgi:hypothetical protein